MSTYQDAGVDLDAAAAVVDAIGATVRSTWGPDAVGAFGGFAGGITLPPGLKDPVLMLSTDGIGTKLDLARRLGQTDGVGFDLVAMVVDDLAAAGARSIALTDYIAVGRLDPAEVAGVVDSVAAACREASVALVGGETAEHPGTLPPDALDVSATALGVIERDEMFDPTAVGAGDAIIGVTSPNLRSNGFSLVRAILDATPDDDLARAALAPSVIYSPAALDARPHVKAFAHITGGGIDGNLPRVLPPGVGAVVDESAWVRPPIFDELADRGGVDHTEMRRVFNMGIGFAAVVDANSATRVIEAFGGHGHGSALIGEVIAGPDGVHYLARP